MTRERNLKSGSVGSVGSAEFLPADRDLYSRLPETYSLEPWELRHVLFSLGYVDDLADEAEIAAAVEVARADWPQWRAVRLCPQTPALPPKVKGMWRSLMREDERSQKQDESA